MEPIVLDTDCTPLAVFDVYQSLIWTECYCEYGDFEIYTNADSTVRELFTQNRYLKMKGSDRVMIIETIKTTSDVENGDMITVTGRSLESILERRIIWGQTTLSGNFQNGIKKLLDQNVISPDLTIRKINNFIFQPSDDPKITDLTVSAQFTGDNLYDAIKALCDARGVGFKITLSDDGNFVFSLYSGADRSYNQSENPYVIFSPKLENVINTEHTKSNANFKNIALVAGEGEGADLKSIWFIPKAQVLSGLIRRELYVDARDISSSSGDISLSDDDYTELLMERGKEKLIEYTEEESFDGQIESGRVFEYGRDFFLGDIVQLSDGKNVNSRLRTVSVTRSRNADGTEVYPKFVIVE